MSPAVVISLPATLSNLEDHIKEKLKHFEAVDDVYDPVFAESGNFIFQHPEQHRGELGTAADALSAPYGTCKVEFNLIGGGGGLPEGPYFLSGNSVHQAWRLYADDLRAFVVATVPVGNIGFNEVNKVSPCAIPIIAC